MPFDKQRLIAFVATQSSRKNVSMKSEPQLDVEPLLEPWLKDLLDRVVIPALLREFRKSVVDSAAATRAQSLKGTPKGDVE